jgi:hypothetical protein
MFTGGSLWAFPPTEHSPGIIYLVTQANMHRATLPYLRKALRRLATWTEMNAVSSVALLQIAAGLGKLSWLNQYQKDSALARWYRGRTENANGSRKKLIVALARKLLIALWHFVRDGVVPEGVVLRPAQ